MYIFKLLKIYYSSFSAFTACTFHSLIDGRSLVKTKLNHLINCVCFRVRSITKTADILMRNTKITTLKNTVKSTVHGTWNMENTRSVCWLRTDLRDGVRPDSHVTALWTVHIVKKRHIFCLIVLQTLIFVIKSTWLAFKISWRRVTGNFLWIILIWFC